MIRNIQSMTIVFFATFVMLYIVFDLSTSELIFFSIGYSIIDLFTILLKNWIESKL